MSHRYLIYRNLKHHITTLYTIIIHLFHNISTWQLYTAIVSLSYRYRPSFYAIYFDVQVLSIYYPIALKLQISQMKCKAGALVVRIEQRSMYYMVQFALNLLSNLEFICVSCSQFPESNSHEPSNEVSNIICYFLPLFAGTVLSTIPMFSNAFVLKLLWSRHE